MKFVLTPFFSGVLHIVFLVMGISFLITFIRLFKGPSVPDRVVALDLIAALAVGVIALFAVASQKSLYVDCAITLALIAFLSTVAFARYLLKRGSDDE